VKREILPSCFFKEKACNGTQALAINKSMINIKQKTRSEAGLKEGAACGCSRAKHTGI